MEKHKIIIREIVTYWKIQENYLHDGNWTTIFTAGNDPTESVKQSGHPDWRVVKVIEEVVYKR
jgi:hypothetical protein